jgi:hypothetical protein
MPVSKHLSRNQHKKRSKNKVIPCTDANQRIIEHDERVRKQNAYIIRKLAELKAKQQEMMEQQRLAQQSTESQTIDGMAGSRDVANE